MLVRFPCPNRCRGSAELSCSISNYARFVSTCQYLNPKPSTVTAGPQPGGLLRASCSWEYGIRTPPRDGVASHFSPVKGLNPIP